MKLPELKKHFQKKYVIRIVAGVLTVALLGGGAAVYNGRSVEADAATSTESAASSEDDIDLEGMISRSTSDVDKEETVYLLSDAEGNVKETIVTDHLHNNDGSATIKDKSDLSDITNTKGSQKFDQSGQELTWQADGGDIYYRGSKSGEAPIAQKVTYYLDGKEISPKELAGKSGKVKIHFDYENKSEYKATVNGKEETVTVPFAAVTVLALDEHFSNIEVSNGKVRSNGDTNIVIGTALPGLKDSLGVEDNDFAEDIDLPDGFEVTADVDDFSLSMAMTVVMNATELTDISGIDTAKLDDTIKDLSEASDKLEDGSGDLADGLDTLDSSLGTFSNGMKTLSDGLTAYTDGAKKLDGGISKVKDGVDTLDGSKKALADGVKQLKDGADSAADGAKQLESGYKGDGTAKNPGLLAGTKSLSEGAATLAAGIDTLSEGIQGDGTAKNPGLLAGTKSLAAGAKTVDENMQALAAGAKALDDGVDTLVGTMSNMPKTMTSGVQEKIDEGINDNAAAIGLLNQAGLVQGKLKAENVAAVAEAYTANRDAIIESIINLGLKQQGMTIEAATLKTADPGSYITAYTTASKTYEELLAGLRDAKGAMEAAASTTAQLTSKENQEQIKKLTDGSEALKDSAAKLQKEGTAVVSAGASTVYSGVQKLDDGVKKLDNGSDTLSSGSKTIYSGVQKLSKGTSSLSSGLGKLDGGLVSLNKKFPSLTEGIGALKKGVDQLADGSGELVSNNSKLNNGMGDLLTGTKKIVDGVDQLDDGSHKLSDGMAEFNEKAIDKLVNSYNGDVKDFADRIQAVLDAGRDYQTFSQVADGQTGSVKFVYKLDAIETE